MNRNMLKYIDEFNERGDMLIDKLRPMADGKTVVHIYEEISYAVFDIIANVFKNRFFF